MQPVHEPNEPGGAATALVARFVDDLAPNRGETVNRGWSYIPSRRCPSQRHQRPSALHASCVSCLTTERHAAAAPEHVQRAHRIEQRLVVSNLRAL
eukprot:3039771-Pleurochrysis_carterae.AAC.3